MCRFLIWGFALAYAAAVVLLLIGTFGLFGQERDPLSGVFLVPVGLPWNLLGGGLPAPWLPVIGVLAPAVNLAILVAICRAFRASATS